MQPLGANTALARGFANKDRSAALVGLGADAAPASAMAASLPLLVPTPGHAPLVGTGAAASGADEALQQSPYGHVAAELVRPKPKRPRKGVRDPLAQHGYTTLGPIARGAFATVTKAVVKSTGEEVAVKSFLKKRKSTATPGEMALGMTRTVEDDVVKGTRELEVLRLLAAQAEWSDASFGGTVRRRRESSDV